MMPICHDSFVLLMLFSSYRNLIRFGSLQTFSSLETWFKFLQYGVAVVAPVTQLLFTCAGA
jgi:hypothetical protein